MASPSLAAGTRLGPYEILSVLGAGGMGEVYRARDTKLNRDVAIKVLLAAVANDPDRLARFSREAQVLASLNHPNIAHIHGLEDAGAVRALVMELVDGPTLADRIAHGPMPVNEVIPIARQIADALEAAHEQGIVHRDLKPANIKVRDDGTVKVLDFGLAKAMDPTPSSVNAMNSPTLTAATIHGVIIGTAAYMSPEQARGKAVDKRADIWAFGVVLFEMLSGRAMYTGETVTDVLAGIVTGEPEWSRLPAATPPALRRLIARCLEKNPQRRLRDIGEARIALDPRGAVDVAQTAAIPEAARAPRPWTIALALVLAGAGFAAAWLLRDRSSGVAAPMRLEATLPPGVTIPVDTYNVIAISRDGSRVAIVGARDGVTRIYMRTLREFEARPLPGTEGAVEPFFSPDGAWVGFFANRSLKKTPAEGGLVVTIIPCGTVRGAVWTESDTIIYPENGTTGLSSVPASGGQPHRVTTVDAQKNERTHRLPSLLPDGKTVLFNVDTFTSPEDYDDATIEAVRLDTGTRKVIMQGGRMPVYSSTGDLLYVRGNVLYAVAFDPRQLELKGRPRPIIDGVLGDPTTGASFYAMSGSGTLAYIPGNPSVSARLMAWVDRDGKGTAIDLPPALYTEPHLSPDGARATFSIIVEGSRDRDVWVADFARGASIRLTSRGTNWTPVWSPDGNRVFSVAYDGERNRSTFEARAAGGSEATTIGTFEGTAYISDVTPDGATLFVTARPTTGSRWRSYRLGSTGDADRRPQEIPQSADANMTNAVVSPDGLRIAYATWAVGNASEPIVYVQSIESAGDRIQVSGSSAFEPHWSPDGRQLYFVQGNGIVEVSLDTGSTVAPGRPRQLPVTVLPSAVESAQTYDVDRKSGRFLVLHAVGEHPPTPGVRFMLNGYADARGGAR